MTYDIKTIEFRNDNERVYFEARLSKMHKEISDRLLLADALDSTVDQKVLIFLDRFRSDAKYFKRFKFDPILVYKDYLHEGHIVLERIFPTKFYNYVGRMLNVDLQLVDDYDGKVEIFEDYETRISEEFQYTSYYPMVLEAFKLLRQGFLK